MSTVTFSATPVFDLSAGSLIKITLTSSVLSGTYTSGITATGTVGQTCTLTALNGGGSGATATVALTGTDTIAGSTALVITAGGTGYGSAPTSATAGNGTATCSGTATISTVIHNGNVTSSTLTNLVAGQSTAFLICQDAAGSHTFAWPTAALGATTIGSTASKCTAQEFVSDGTSLYAKAAGVTNQ